MRYGNYSGAFSRRKLFPPVVPTSIPAFDGTQTYKIFFKKSAANFATSSGQSADFKHVQMSIRKISNNANPLDTSYYKTGYVIAKVSTRSLDEPGLIPEPNTAYRVYGRDDKSPYCLFLSGTECSQCHPTFSELNTLYKVQLRLGEDEYRDDFTVADIQKMNTEGRVSEWSTVLAIKPIEAPNFGIFKFEDYSTEAGKAGNKIATANFQYVGYYESNYIRYGENGEPIFATVNEKLSEYWFKLYDSQNKLLSDSGPIVTIEHDRANISHTFNFLTKDRTDYFVDFGIKTENGYTAQKRYLVTGDYKALEMSNAMVRVANNPDMARMEVQVQAKQVVLQPIIKRGTEDELSKLGFTKDTSDPQYKNSDLFEQSRTLSTHAAVEGSVQTSKSFYLSCPNDIWTIEAKTSGIIAYDTREEAMEKPYIILENDYSLEKDVLYYTRMKVICYKKEEFDFGVNVSSIITDSNGIKRFAVSTKTPTYIYYLEAIKTSYKKIGGEEKEIATQSSKTRSVVKSTFKPGTRPENMREIAELQYNIKQGGSLNRYVYDETRFNVVDVPDETLLDTVYFDKNNPENPKVIKQKVENKKSIVSNESVPFDPLKENYLFLSNNRGSFYMCLFDDGYVTQSADLKQYLQTKTLTPSMQVEALEKF